jgi:hypothetical protein
MNVSFVNLDQGALPYFKYQGDSFFVQTFDITFSVEKTEKVTSFKESKAISVLYEKLIEILSKFIFCENVSVFIRIPAMIIPQGVESDWVCFAVMCVGVAGNTSDGKVFHYDSMSESIVDSEVAVS